MARKLKQTKSAQASRRAYRKKHHKTIHRRSNRTGYQRLLAKAKAAKAKGRGRPKKKVARAYKYVLKGGTLHYSGRIFRK